MKKTIKTISSLITSFAIGVSLCAGQVLAAPMSVQEGAEAARADGMPTELIGADGILTRISNTILMVVGTISVVMLIWGGLRYVISGGDSKKVTDAKNTILYAIIGLIICILAYAIVNFVINTVSSVTA